jgi:dTDP-4-dehydrorhamnose reductase
MKKKLILILGVSGMLGNALFRGLSRYSDFAVYGSTRGVQCPVFFTQQEAKRILCNLNVMNSLQLSEALDELKPDFVINCIGVIKQRDYTSVKSDTIAINSLFPHLLAEMCSVRKMRLIHFSTDCVFDGKRGGYVDSDLPNALDLYGQSKALGEVSDDYALTIRTSIIGHEISSNLSLIDWFLSQEGTVEGFQRAIFSGLPTPYFSRIIRLILDLPCALSGVYNVSAEPINKFDLLTRISKAYGHTVNINENIDFEINRSLASEPFWAAINSKCKGWDDLIKLMHDDYLDVLQRRRKL